MACGTVLCVRVTQSVSWKVIQPHIQVSVVISTLTEEQAFVTVSVCLSLCLFVCPVQDPNLSCISNTPFT